jgi:hypothetical protein
LSDEEIAIRQGFIKTLGNLHTAFIDGRAT